jgi:hypothetical protein
MIIGADMLTIVYRLRNTGYWIWRSVKAEPSSTFIKRRLICRDQGLSIWDVQGAIKVSNRKLTAHWHNSVSNGVNMLCLLSCVNVSIIKHTTIISIPA